MAPTTFNENGRYRHPRCAKENQNMRHHTLVSITAAGALALLAACSNNDATPQGEADLAATEAEVAEKQAELAKLEADLAEQQAANNVPPAAPKPSTAPKPATTRPASNTSTPKPAPAPVASTVTVPAGTQLSLSLSTALSSKSSKVGDTVRAVVTDNVVVDGRTAIASGTTVAGSVIKVVSGSDRIGGTPQVVMAFDRLELPGGKDVPITGEFTSSGKSDNTRDTVKIVGGAAAGALLGDQVSKKDRGKVIGGILGAAAGAVAAKETGTEVKLAEGAPMALTLSAPVEVTR
jgi:type IV secretory pathway VirB10-like protein